MDMPVIIRIIAIATKNPTPVPMTPSRRLRPISPLEAMSIMFDSTWTSGSATVAKNPKMNAIQIIKISERLFGISEPIAWPMGRRPTYAGQEEDESDCDHECSDKKPGKVRNIDREQSNLEYEDNNHYRSNGLDDFDTGIFGCTRHANRSF